MSKIIRLEVKGNSSYDRALTRAFNKSGIDYMKLLFGTTEEKRIEKQKEDLLNKKLSLQEKNSSHK